MSPRAAGMTEHLSIPGDPAELDGTRDKVAAFIDSTLDAQEKNRVILAVDEALANIMEHAYGGDRERRIEMQMEHRDGKLVFTIEDDAEHFDPTGRELDLTRHAAAGHTRGLGIYLYTTLMDVHHETNERGGNRLILSKEIPA